MADEVVYNEAVVILSIKSVDNIWRGDLRGDIAAYKDIALPKINKCLAFNKIYVINMEYTLSWSFSSNMITIWFPLPSFMIQHKISHIGRIILVQLQSYADMLSICKNYCQRLLTV